ncbi:MAG: hypothetical protein GY851_32570 [bacterium]|nr:hypothetical protein [bacterium]
MTEQPVNEHSDEQPSRMLRHTALIVVLLVAALGITEAALVSMWRRNRQPGNSGLVVWAGPPLSPRTELELDGGARIRSHELRRPPEDLPDAFRDARLDAETTYAYLVDASDAQGAPLWKRSLCVSDKPLLVTVCAVPNTDRLVVVLRNAIPASQGDAKVRVLDGSGLAGAARVLARSTGHGRARTDSALRVVLAMDGAYVCGEHESTEASQADEWGEDEARRFVQGTFDPQDSNGTGACWTRTNRNTALAASWVTKAHRVRDAKGRTMTLRSGRAVAAEFEAGSDAPLWVEPIAKGCVVPNDIVWLGDDLFLVGGELGADEVEFRLMDGTIETFRHTRFGLVLRLPEAEEGPTDEDPRS